ncbi:MAG: glucosyl-3-phosphoglycerate synthase, partial [Deltaproteobacteria bacterium]|nr:glucosyl-3-phosphoglycerate synthase [Deltaproteobacteria bacterium]
VDLEKRVHRNQDTKALGRMAFVILKTFLNRIGKLGLIQKKKEMFNEMIQFKLEKNRYMPDIRQLEEHERPPIIGVPEYF